MTGGGYGQQAFGSVAVAEAAQVRSAVFGDDDVDIHPTKRHWACSQARRDNPGDIAAAGVGGQGDDPKSTSDPCATRKIGGASRAGHPT